MMKNEQTNHSTANSIAIFFALALGAAFFGLAWKPDYQIGIILLAENAILWLIPIAFAVAGVGILLERFNRITSPQMRLILCGAGIIALAYYGKVLIDNNFSLAAINETMGVGFWLGLIAMIGLLIQVFIPAMLERNDQIRARREAAAADQAKSGIGAAIDRISEQQPAVGYVVKQFRVNLQTYTLIGALIIIWLLFSSMTEGRFLMPQNFSNLFRQMTITAFLSVGMVLVIVTGGIDLSVGKLAGFVSVVVAVYQARVWGPHITPDQELITTIHSVLIGLSVGVLYGVIQGYIIAYLRVTAFIVTLGSLWLLNGLILLQTEGRTIPANQPIISQVAQGYLSDVIGWMLAGVVVIWLFYSMFSGRQKKQRYGFELPALSLDILKTVFFAALVVVYVIVVNQYKGIQIPVLLLAVAAVIVSYVSNNTRFGRYAYAIGGNREATRLSGINIRKNIFSIFVLMGGLCGVSGVVMASYVGYGTIAAGDGYELDAIAACILGGTSTLGGVGTVFGTMVGSLIMASLTNGLQMTNTPSAYQYVLKGIVLVVAVYADVRFKRSSSSSD